MYKSLSAGMIGVKLDGFEQNLAAAKKYGYGAISYSPDALAAENIDAFKAMDLMGRYGVIISDFGLPVRITGRDAFNESFPALEKAARDASALGIRRCCTWMLSFSNEFEYAENFENHVKMFRLIAGVLNEYGILFGVEFLGPAPIMNSGKFKFIRTLPQMLELCDAVGTGNMGVLLDAHHCYCSGLRGDEFKRYIRRDKDITLVHLNDDSAAAPANELNDSPRYYIGEPGGGANDLPAFLGALADLGYTGPVIVEPFSEALKAIDNDDEKLRLVTEGTNSVWPN